jgi:hypothetical protein
VEVVVVVGFAGSVDGFCGVLGALAGFHILVFVVPLENLEVASHRCRCEALQ